MEGQQDLFTCPYFTGSNQIVLGVPKHSYLAEPETQVPQNTTFTAIVKAGG
jgi:hypothetical protein